MFVEDVDLSSISRKDLKFPDRNTSKSEPAILMLTSGSSGSSKDR